MPRIVKGTHSATKSMRPFRVTSKSSSCAAATKTRSERKPSLGDGLRAYRASGLRAQGLEGLGFRLRA